MKKIITLALVLFVTATASAQLRLPTIFSDKMCLQQQQSNAVWGWATPGEKITVKASWGKEVTATADDNGKWKLFLPTPKFTTGQTITISGKEDKIKLKDVAIGEVWLCLGQSNMGWKLGYVAGGPEEAETANDPNYRIYKSNRMHSHKPLDDCPTGHWAQCKPASANETSAVSYFFGKMLREELGDIPVGIIVQAYAGTPIEGWFPWEAQKDDPKTAAVKALLDEDNNSKMFDRDEGIEKQATAYAQFLKENPPGSRRWDRPGKKLTAPLPRRPHSLGNQYPANIYNAMVHPVVPFGIKGIIWYQGERNAKNPNRAIHFQKQLTDLITFYRKHWNEQSDGNTPSDFPFLFTQLPSWLPPQTQPVEGVEAPWAVSRESMRLVDLNLPNTGMAVTVDTGDPVQLHPKEKRPVGQRLAYRALQDFYDKKIVGSGPVMQRAKVAQGKMVLLFTSIGSGLMSGKKGELNAFAIAGEDKKWHWADAKIEGSTVVVSSPEVPDPVAVRYAWAMNPSQRNLLYNREGFPASPFRTDTWSLAGPELDPAEDSYQKPEKPDKKTYVDQLYDGPTMKPHRQ